MDNTVQIVYPMVKDPEMAFEKSLMTPFEKAKVFLEQYADRLESERTIAPSPREIREVASVLLAPDEYQVLILVLARMSGKPVRTVKRILKSKLKIEG